LSDASAALIAVRSSRLWALFHFNLTRLLFPASMSADQIGVSTTNLDFWLTPLAARRRATAALPHCRGHPYPRLLLGRDQRRELGRA
jgi:hypothetical protein